MNDGFATALQLAGLPGMPGTERGVQLRAQAEQWRSRKRAGRGGGREYDLRDLPAETRQAIVEQLLAAQPSLPAPATASAPQPASATVLHLPVAVASAGFPEPGEAAGGALPAAGVRGRSVAMRQHLDPEMFADWQREAAYARMAIIRRVEEAAKAAGSIVNALELLRAKLHDGGDATLNALAARANVRKRGERADITRATFFRWSTAAKEGGIWALAPADTNRERIPPWARACMQLWARPAKPSIAYVHQHIGEQLAPQGIAAPSYAQLRRFITERLGALARNAGRMGARELLSLQPFVRRNTENLWPTECYTADGHTFDAEIAHPVHGKPFRPEITLVLDVGTRKAVGFSVSLDECGLAVLDAQRQAFMKHGICSAWYVDRGSGYANALQHCEETGMAARLGFTIKHSLPYRSQSRGLIERAHQTILVRAAKELPTYVGAVMDREAKQRVFRITRSEVKRLGKSRLLMPWDAFIPFIQQAVEDYNDRPHRGNQKFRDAHGRLRHMSPNEAWADAVKAGFVATMPEADIVGDLFFPQTLKKVIRGELRLHGKRYFSKALAEYHGEIVRVAYDIHDPSYVIVRDQRGRLLARAERDGNDADYLKDSFIQEANRRRALARKRRLDTRMEEIQEEIDAANTIEGKAREFTPPPEVIAFNDETNRLHRERVQAEAAEHEAAMEAVAKALEEDGIKPAKEEAPKRPAFEFESERYEWLMGHRDQWRDGDEGFCRRFAATELYAMLIERWEMLGIAWREENANPEKAAD